MTLKIAVGVCLGILAAIICVCLYFGVEGWILICGALAIVAVWIVITGQGKR